VAGGRGRVAGAAPRRRRVATWREGPRGGAAPARDTTALSAPATTSPKYRPGRCYRETSVAALRPGSHESGFRHVRGCEDAPFGLFGRCRRPVASIRPTRALDGGQVSLHSTATTGSSEKADAATPAGAAPGPGAAPGARERRQRQARQDPAAARLAADPGGRRGQPAAFGPPRQRRRSGLSPPPVPYPMSRNRLQMSSQDAVRPRQTQTPAPCSSPSPSGSPRSIFVARVQGPSHLPQ
jgi:hypothetical protein